MKTFSRKLLSSGILLQQGKGNLDKQGSTSAPGFSSPENKHQGLMRLWMVSIEIRKWVLLFKTSGL